MHAEDEGKRHTTTTTTTTTTTNNNNKQQMINTQRPLRPDSTRNPADALRLHRRRWSPSLQNKRTPPLRGHSSHASSTPRLASFPV